MNVISSINTEDPFYDFRIFYREIIELKLEMRNRLIYLPSTFKNFTI
ncbi:hypothetical protein QE441_002268 [Chryseobacterium sp. SORGH_AS909]|uniref:Uncharacterized protein n=1 Tax=Chryseobacterium camelliae TaxID=1265445 RepID=A0ABU0TDP5_9FLAO|nr:hypothetical protein [Chryseobacterium camelliae]MDQ1099125.1 hypothetical protein [Chryseobacterium sp. SORGH_AS_1048]MDR6086474.1 hypothetical protein [Chryseobacterium sp. SORGH_AS_0909]MDR6130846.1 hypothetical protein [Chryseobacterium sp. SORGH_AS_1175]MDT3407021.1 hypothetical protein [Pseudacidovorax intermedius]